MIRYAMRLLTMVAVAGCATETERPLSAAETSAIADSIKTMVVTAYDLSKPDPVASLMSLYPGDSLVSASAGTVVRTRGELEQQVKTFWNYVGVNMQKPKWE